MVERVLELRIDRIAEFMTNTDLESRRRLIAAIPIHGLLWEIFIEPDYLRSYPPTRALRFFLECEGVDDRPNWSYRARSTFRVVSLKEGVEDLTTQIVQTFSKGRNSNGSKAIRCDELLDPKKSFVKDDTVIVRVNMKAEVPRRVPMFWRKELRSVEFRESTSPISDPPDDVLVVGNIRIPLRRMDRPAVPSVPSLPVYRYMQRHIVTSSPPQTKTNEIVSSSGGTPASILAETVSFMCNNLSNCTLLVKAGEMKSLIANNGGAFVRWFAEYVVMKRVVMETNHQHLYNTFLLLIKNECLDSHVEDETVKNAKALLTSDKEQATTSDRLLLTNIGQWLGLITLARDRPILIKDLDLKLVLVQAFHNGEKELLFTVPFVTRTLTASKFSTIFRPTCAWVSALISLLVEIHSEPDLKLNLKFEIEQLCTDLNVNMRNIGIRDYLRQHKNLKRGIQAIRQHGNHSVRDDDLIRLNVGGKIFATRRCTLSQYSESFLAQLVDSRIQNKQDRSGTYLIDRSYEHFDTILNFLRCGSTNFGKNKKALKDLLREAEFYRIYPMVSKANEYLGRMQIFVRMIDGRQITFMVCKDDAVATLKEKIYAKEGIEKDDQRLTYSGRQLEDERFFIGLQYPKGEYSAFDSTIKRMLKYFALKHCVLSHASGKEPFLFQR